MLKGLLAGGVTLGVAAVFPQDMVFPFLAVVLGLMAGVEPGMAMWDPDRGRPTPQWVVALVVVGLALFGLWLTPLFLAGAWLLHWLWNILLQITALGDGAPEGFSRFSLSFDLVLAGFSIYMWSVGA